MWYVLQVKSGDELNIRNRLHELGFPAAAPSEMAQVRKGGEWQAQQRVLFPRYVFVSMAYSAENYYKVKGIPGVGKFLSAGGAPSCLSFLEAEWIKLLTFEGVALEPTKMAIGEGDKLVVVDGIMKHFTNRILSADKHKRKAVFEITICAEPYKLELSIEIV